MGERTQRKIYALICGAMRSEFELCTTIARLCDMRANGLICGIAISTWTGETDYIPGIREKLKQLDILLIESEEPTDVISANPVYLRQAYQIRRALDILPEDIWVLKCRTDFSNYDLNRFEVERFLTPDMERFDTPACGTFDAGLSHKIAILRAGVSLPFALHDICFFGYGPDIRKLLNFENTQLLYGIGGGSDYWMFMGGFAKRFPVITDLMKCVSYDVFCGNMKELSFDGEPFFLPAALNKFYALYFLILYQAFVLYHDTELPVEMEVSLRDVFLTKPEAKITKSWLVEVRSYDVIKRIVEGRLSLGEGYEGLLAEIKKMQEGSYALTCRITREERKELIAWGEAHFKEPETGWIRPDETFENLPGKVTSDFNGAAKLLFSGYNVDKTALEALREIAFHKESYYKTIEEHFSDFEACDIELYKKALYTAIRYPDENTLSRLKQLAASQDNVTEREKTFIADLIEKAKLKNLLT